MFTIIGADQKQYGPYTVEEIREWIAQGRADGRTLARAEGTLAWTPLATLPEFAGTPSLGGAPPRLSPNPAANAPHYVNDPNAPLLGSAPDFKIGECLSRGAGLLSENFAVLAGACAIFWVLDDMASYLPLVGILFQGVLFGGLFLVFLKRLRGEPVSISDVFSGFGGSFVQLALTGFLYVVLSTLAFCACILPMFYLEIAWIFALPLVIDKKLEFWTAMELSRKVTTRVWFKAFALVVLVFAPYLIARVYVSHKTEQLINAQVVPLIKEAGINFSNLPDLLQKITPIIQQIAKDMTTLNLIAQLVFLANLPFGMAALMSAYESLFGTRKAPAP